MWSGPLPKPTQQKLDEGNASKQSKAKLNLNQPVPEELESLAPPEWLTEDARALWIKYAIKYQRSGMLKSIDVPKFSAYVQAVAEFVNLNKQIDSDGVVISGVNGQGSTYIQANLKCVARDRAFDRMNKLGIQFGDSPAARARLSVDDGSEKNSLASFLSRKPKNKAQEKAKEATTE